MVGIKTKIGLRINRLTKLKAYYTKLYEILNEELCEEYASQIQEEICALERLLKTAEETPIELCGKCKDCEYYTKCYGAMGRGYCIYIVQTNYINLVGLGAEVYSTDVSKDFNCKFFKKGDNEK